MPTICTDFYTYRDNDEFPPLPSNFTIGIFGFRELGGTNPLFVNVTDAPGSLVVPGQGLQFPPDGLEITPAVKRARATLSVGTFNGPVELSALDSAGAVLRLVVIPGNNKYNTVTMSTRKRFDHLVLTDGGNEAILERICMTI